jgi:hypothetical protein
MTISDDELKQLQEFTNRLSLAGADNDVVVQCVGYHEETDEYEFAKFATLGGTEIASKVYSILVNFPALAAELLELRELREQTRWIPVTERLPEFSCGMASRPVEIACYYYGNRTPLRKNDVQFWQEHGWVSNWENGKPTTFKELGYTIYAWRYYTPLPEAHDD